MSEDTNTGTSKKIMSLLFLGIIIFVSGYNILIFVKEKKEKEAKEKVWTQKDFNDLVERCVKDTGERGIDFPEITTQYCECSTKSITSVIPKNEYLILVKQPTNVQAEKLMPSFKNCLDDYLAKVNKLEGQQK